MKNRLIPQSTIDEAGKIRTSGKTWQDTAEIIFQSGFTDSNGHKVHNMELCIKTLQDPNWSHLRVNKYWSVDRLNVLKTVLSEEGVTGNALDNIMKRLGQ